MRAPNNPMEAQAARNLYQSVMRAAVYLVLHPTYHPRMSLVACRGDELGAVTQDGRATAILDVLGKRLESQGLTPVLILMPTEDIRAGLQTHLTPNPN